MKKKFMKEIDLKIYTIDSPEAKNYELRSSTAVFVNDELVPPDTAFSSQEMETFLKNSL